MKVFKLKSGFTLMEILIVVVILSVSAGVAYVNYTKLLTRKLEERTRFNLELIRNANEIYRAKHGHYWPSHIDGWNCASAAWCNLEEINANLNLNIQPEQNFDYACCGECSFDGTTLPVSDFACYGSRQSDYFSLNFVSALPFDENHPCCGLPNSCLTVPNCPSP
ncbi:MAG: type II secretion system protein [Candidatus Omnitrophota bacterium]